MAEQHAEQACAEEASEQPAQEAGTIEEAAAERRGRRRRRPPGWPGWVMLRSIGRALGAVVVEGGEENVCEPRLPKLRIGRASASPSANSRTVATAHSASSGRKRRICSSQNIYAPIISVFPPGF